MRKQSSTLYAHLFLYDFPIFKKFRNEILLIKIVIFLKKIIFKYFHKNKNKKQICVYEEKKNLIGNLKNKM